MYLKVASGLRFPPIGILSWLIWVDRTYGSTNAALVSNNFHVLERGAATARHPSFLRPLLPPGARRRPCHERARRRVGRGVRERPRVARRTAAELAAARNACEENQDEEGGEQGAGS